MNKYLQLFRIGNAFMGIIGVTVASFMAWKGQGLLPVAIGACAAVACAQGICLLV